LGSANLSEIKASGLLGNPAALPTGWVVRAGYLFGPGANLSEVDFTTADLSNINLAGVNLNSAKLADANLTRIRSGSINGVPSTLPSGWVIRSGFLIGETANLANANLSGLDLSNTNLNQVDLSGSRMDSVNLADAYLAGANLANVKSSKIAGTPANLPAHWELSSGYLIGPGASFEGVDFGQANLSYVNMAGTNISGARLDRVTMNGIRSGNILGIPSSLPDGWNLIGGYLIGPNADLRGASLQGLDLSGAVLDGVTSGGISGTPSALPDNWKLAEGSFIKTFDAVLVPTISGIAAFGAEVKAILGQMPDGAVVESQWLVDGFEIPGATTSVFVPSEVHIGHSLQFRIFVTGFGYEPTTRLSASRLVQKASFQNVNAPALPTKIVLADRVTVMSGNWPAGTSLTYQWYLDEKEIAGATQAEYVTTVSDVSHALKVKVVGTAPGFESLTKISDSRVVQKGTIPDGSGYSVSGKFSVGSVVSVTGGNWAPEVYLTYEWLLGGQPIKDAKQASYLISPAALNKLLSVRISASKSGHETKVVILGDLLVKPGTVKAAPVPKISGTAVVGKKLKATPGTWDRGVKLTYQWLLDGKPIAKATSSSYLILKTQKKHKISVKVTGTLAGYTTVFKTSSALVVK
jgi:uncharacterized protein YjbI with pentapeptide repeats